MKRVTIRILSECKNIETLKDFGIKGILVDTPDSGYRNICACGRVSKDEDMCTDCKTPISEFLTFKISDDRYSYYTTPHAFVVKAQNPTITNDDNCFKCTLETLTLKIEQPPCSTSYFSLDSNVQTIFEINSTTAKIISIGGEFESIGKLFKNYIEDDKIANKAFSQAAYLLDKIYSFTDKYPYIQKNGILEVVYETFKANSSHNSIAMIISNLATLNIDLPPNTESFSELLSFVGVPDFCHNEYIEVGIPRVCRDNGSAILNGKDLFPRKEYEYFPENFNSFLKAMLKHRHITLDNYADFLQILYKYRDKIEVSNEEVVSYDLLIRYLAKILPYNKFSTYEFTVNSLVSGFFSKTEELKNRYIFPSMILNQKAYKMLDFMDFMKGKGYAESRVDAIIDAAKIDMKEVLKLLPSKAKIKPA